VIRLRALPLLLVLATPPASAIEVRSTPGALHGFPSMSDEAGVVIADGELAQERRGRRLVVHARWIFGDGRVAEESATFSLASELAQETFAWVESSKGEEQRRFEVDFSSGRAVSLVRRDGELQREEEQLDLPRGRSFTGYGTALAVSQLPLEPGESAELTFVAFTPKPRTVTLTVRNDGEAHVSAAGRRLLAERFTLHPEIPFPISLFAKAPDAHLWFTRRAPRALLRAEQNLIAKDDPRVVIDVIPRGAAERRDAAPAGG
jgi:hypothetical protein